MKLYHLTCRSVWVVTREHILGGGEPPPPLKIWKGKKRLKFSTFYDNFWLWLWISLDWIEISKKTVNGVINCNLSSVEQKW